MFHVKKDKKQAISLRNYYKCRLCRWSTTSCKQNPCCVAWSKQQIALASMWKCYIVMCRFTSSYTLAYTCRIIHNDTINKQTSEDFFRRICASHFIVRVRQGYSKFYGERELEAEQNCNILTPTLMAVSVVSFLFSRAAQPEAQGPHSAGFLYHILSATSLDPNSTGVPEGPFGLVWFSLPRFVSYSNSIGVPEGPLRRVVVFSTTSCLCPLWSQTHWLPVFTELYNNSSIVHSIAHSIAHSIFGMACLIVIKRK